MRRVFPVTALLTLGALMVLGFAPAGRQDDRPGRLRVPEFERNIAVNYMLVDVIVTDADGNYVRNLTRDDFELFENGKKVDIRSIDEYQMGTPTSGGSMEEMAASTLEPQQPPRNIIIFVDLLYSSSFGIKRAVDVAQDFVLDRIQKGDRVMVVTYYNSLKVVQPFTNDKEQVIRAMESSGISSDAPMARLEAPSGTRAATEPGISDTAMFQEELGQRRLEVQTDQLYSQANARNYFLSLKALAGVVRQYPGRKTLIMLSEGIDSSLIDPREINDDNFGLLARQDATESMFGYVPPQRLTSLMPVFKDTLEVLNDAKVSVYTVNVGGLIAIGNATDQFSAADPLSGGQSMQPGETERKKRQEFLSGLASDTGGRAYFNTNDMRRLLDSIEVDISNYYILGYNSQFSPNRSEYRDVTVRLKKPGLNVLHRKGFFTPRPFTSLGQDERDMQLTEGFLTRSQINELDAHAAYQFVRTSPQRLSASVALELPVRGLKATESGGYDVQVLVANINSDGKIFSSVHKRYTVEGNPALAERGIRLVESVDSESGLNMLRVALRDNLTGKRTYFYYDYMFRQPAEDALLVSSPMFYDPATMKRGSDEFRIGVKSEEKWDMDAPGGGTDPLVHPDGSRFFPLLRPTYTEKDTVHFVLQVYNLKREFANAEDLEVVFAISPAEHKKGTQRDYHRVNVADQQIFRMRTGDGVTISGSFRLGGLPAGAYDLFSIITDKQGGRKEASAGRLYLIE
jgi:VWFA-related protein